jgi:GTP:adenosylcobinamide-phosphate guanylyltransferase
LDAIITAGGSLKPDDPLYQRTGVEKKALIPLVGRPMVSWVLDALRDSRVVNNMVIVGLQPDDLDSKDDQFHFVDQVGGMLDNIFAGFYRLQEINPSAKKLLLVSSDIPLITPEIIRNFVKACGSQEADIYYAVVSEKTMEAGFPNSKRTFVPFKGGRYAGGDILLVDVAAAAGNADLVRSLTNSRKNFLKQARLIGLGFILKFLLRMMTVQEAGKQAAQRGNLKGQVIDTEFAELAMDVDKLHQYEMIQAYLQKRETQIL